MDCDANRSFRYTINRDTELVKYRWWVERIQLMVIPNFVVVYGQMVLNIMNKLIPLLETRD